MSVPRAAIDLVKEFEGCRLTAYRCPAGVPTIGWGATGPDVSMGMTWTQEHADERLVSDLGRMDASISRFVKVPLTDNQRSAILAFTFNVGATALKNSTLLRLLNEGKPNEAAEQFLVWNKAGGKVLPGLSRRRVAERKLFLTK